MICSSRDYDIIEFFLVHIATITSEMNIHLGRQVQIALLKTKEASVTVLAKYLDYANVFSEIFTAVLLKHIKINTHTINLEEGKQPPYRPIYSLRPVELEILKTYIKINLAYSFICPSKSAAGAPILFKRKPDGSLYLYINYQGLNNLIIKNQYPLPLIRESLN